jgi:hypothetical protein
VCIFVLERSTKISENLAANCLNYWIILQKVHFTFCVGFETHKIQLQLFFPHFVMVQVCGAVASNKMTKLAQMVERISKISERKLMRSLDL